MSKGAEGYKLSEDLQSKEKKESSEAPRNKEQKDVWEVVRDC